MLDRVGANGNVTQKARPTWWSILLAAMVPALLVVGLFFPILGFEFVDFDVYPQVIDNPHIRGLTTENLKHIFTSRCLSSYYPVRTLTYAIDWQIWRLKAGGFKLTNGLIHLGNVLLVFWLVLRLLGHPAAPRGTRGPFWDLAVAAFSAGLFAVHPVVVEPVTWIAGREELLMTLGALGSIHFHLAARRFGAKPGRTRPALACHAGAVFCCAAACLSNAVAAVIPMLITASDLLIPPRPKLWRILAGTGPLWLIGAATIVIKRVCESDAVPILPAAFSLQRVMLILDVYWLNLKTLFWPTQLAVYYDWSMPRSFLEGEVILGGAAIVLTGALLWKLRRRTLLLFGLVWFGIALAPTAQLMPHHIQRADRFLYLPLVGLAAALGVGLRPLARAWKGRAKPTRLIVLGGAVGLILLGARSAIQVQTWRNSLSVWGQCLSIDRDNAAAHDAFADNWMRKGRLDLAIPHYETVLRTRPNNIEALNAYAMGLATGDEKLRDYPRAVELATRACELSKWESDDVLETLALAHVCFALDLQEKGDFGEAIHHYRMALKAKPDHDVTLFNLALLRATCPNQKLRRPQEAVRLAEQACKVAESPNLNGLLILATAYAQAGQFSMAALATEKAIELAEAKGDAKLVGRLRRQLRLYQDRTSASDRP